MGMKRKKEEWRIRNSRDRMSKSVGWYRVSTFHSEMVFSEFFKRMNSRCFLRI